MMEELINYILRFGQLNDRQIALVGEHVREIRLKRGEYFSEAGKVARQIGFLTDGILRVCHYNNKGEEFTRYFISENRFAVDLNSFHNEIPSAEYVEAVTDCTLLVISKSSFAELSGIITGWSDIFTRIITHALMGKVQASSTMLIQDATTRYLHFIEHNPGVANRIPLSALASCLGITQSSLSRIRKNIM